MGRGGGGGGKEEEEEEEEAVSSSSRSLVWNPDFNNQFQTLNRYAAIPSLGV